MQLHLILSAATVGLGLITQAQNTFPSSGKVGVGTSSPQQLLHVEGPTLLNLFVSTSPLSSISGSGMIGYAKALPTASGQRLGYFLVGSRGGAQNNYNAAGMVGYAAGAWTAGSSHPAYLAFETTPSGSAARNERLRITSNGDVGIGTTSPTGKLEIRDGHLVVSNTSSSANLILKVNSSNTNASNQILFQDNASTRWALGGAHIGSAGINDFSLYNYTTSSNVLTVLNSNSNVGIGTTSPSSKLHVEDNTIGVAIHGNSTGNSSGGSTIGVYGSAAGYGVYGYSGSSTGTGVHGSGGNFGIQGESNGYGVYGSSSTSYISNGSTGVYGTGYFGMKGNGTFGVYATGGFAALYGEGSVYGIEAFSSDASGGAAVYGGGASVGVQGYGNNYGVYGNSASGGYAGYFTGSVYATTYTGSDRRLKQNITDFRSAINIIDKLQPKLYEYRQDGAYKLMHLPEGKHYGLIAQDVAQILPNLVKETTFDTRMAQAPLKEGQRNTQPSEVVDFKAVNYTELIPILVKAMQEQQTQIEDQRKQNETLQTRIEKLESLLSSHKTNTSTNLPIGYLEQNIPNPAKGGTIIRYHVPAESALANLTLTNANGQILREIRLQGKGIGQVNLNTTALPSGVYNYSLWIDGKETASKQLVIAR